MSETIIINAAPQGGQKLAASDESGLAKLLKYAIYAVIIALLIGAIIAAYFVIDNWEWLMTTFTTGALGWLNPFDNDEGDTNPVAKVKEDYWDTPLSLAWWWPPNWWS